MSELREWLEEQYSNLCDESTDVTIAQYKREGMLLATELIIQKVNELEDNINTGSQGEGETAEGIED